MSPTVYFRGEFWRVLRCEQTDPLNSAHAAAVRLARRVRSGEVRPVALHHQRQVLPSCAGSRAGSRGPVASANSNVVISFGSLCLAFQSAGWTGGGGLISSLRSV